MARRTIILIFSVLLINIVLVYWRSMLILLRLLKIFLDLWGNLGYGGFA